ncbi:hypothetical protein C086_01519 [Brucella abortus F6/05-3]|uniref:patatin-like phospholipase family protein n=1 Tax=Brucella abortus TaxID=235 RepID=UPI0002CE50B8|nr:patatin-like phospholipase family protein [Brucella abortus]ENP35589.1 hypothetical protein C088_01488 [Brucella abortus 65/110]ENP41522.1 hypothetical protein C055_01426 [Brucella abortus 78/36]ENR86340.1 hypothetical protein B996_01276 [Brucella abortus 78/14]ENR91472.1 hypothetical protein C043_01487 [Brucella abortus 80/101]ENR97517.1 hypothetical protein B973_01277 [Brucella abortus 80/28]
MHKSIISLLASTFLLGGCVSDVGPINSLSLQPINNRNEFVPDPGDDGSTVVGLAFSGGGTRAAAFGYGILRAMDETIIDTSPYERSLVDDIRMMSGVSGGAVLAAYFGLKGRDGYRNFREDFLIKNGEKNMHTSVLSPVVAIGALKGGANDRSSFAKWLDENVFHGATYAGLKWKNAPSIWISASDIYHRVPFHFSAETFAALCSNLDDIRVADAVAASAAVPVVFKPINISTHSGRCAPKNPEWLQNALDDPDASIRLKAYGRALQSYRSADVNYIKLLDGALTDNLGVTPLALARASSLTPYGPLSEKETVRLKTLIYVVADAGRETEYPWVRKLDGPAITEILGAVTDTTISSSVREGFDALNLALSQWRNDLIDYRCKLPAATVKKYRGTLKGWNCREVDFYVQRLSVYDLPKPMQPQFNDVPTRLLLPEAQVDLAIRAGYLAFNSNPRLQQAIRRIQFDAGVTKKQLLATK